MTPRLLMPMLVTLFLPVPAQALLESCSVSAQPTAFGSYNPTSGAVLDTTGQITVTCTAVLSIAVSYTISLSAGGSGSATARRMSGSSATLPYNLYTDSTRSTIWGNGTGGTGTQCGSSSNVGAGHVRSPARSNQGG